jgi:ABC-type cobalamin/Fe3+-siderophores transport system ATPase subunit
MLLEIKNFRSIKEQAVQLAPLTVLYGLNGAGKSSLIYALLTLKNVLLNPNQACDAFFNYGWLSLGSFKAVAFEHIEDREIALTIKLPEQAKGLSHAVTLQSKNVRFDLHAGEPYNFGLTVTSSLPYPANQPVQHTYPGASKEAAALTVTWTGVTAEVQAGGSSDEDKRDALDLGTRLNACAEAMRALDVVPVRRGFFKPHYAVTPMTPTLATEDEMATYLAIEKYVSGELSMHLEAIVGRNFTANSKPGTPIFSLDTVERATRVSTELVNDGFGINQLVYLLAKALHPGSRTVCIEEPEIHLHPSAVRNLLKALASIAKEKDKRFVLTTHSEAVVFALLALVKGGQLDPGDIACYLTRKEKRETIFERQEVERSGQIAGGLASFMEGEQEDLETFLGVSAEDSEEENARPATRGE